jgi:uncharacterized membrane protein YGL010W
MSKSKQSKSFPLSLIAAHVASLTIFYIMIKAAISFGSVNEALAFYGVYHRDPTNQVVHFFGVPCIIWSLMVFLSHLKLATPQLLSFKIPTVTLFGGSAARLPPHPANYATLVVLGYVIFYLQLDPFGGALYAPFAYWMYIAAVSTTLRDQQIASKEEQSSSSPAHWTGTGKALRKAFFFHILGWYVQIHLGHHVYEGATPAALNSLGGALTTAPLFAFYEGLWFVGIHTDLQERVLELVDIYTKELCSNGSTMRVCETLVDAAMSS